MANQLQFDLCEEKALLMLSRERKEMEYQMRWSPTQAHDKDLRNFLLVSNLGLSNSLIKTIQNRTDNLFETVSEMKRINHQHLNTWGAQNWFKRALLRSYRRAGSQVGNGFL